MQRSMVTLLAALGMAAATRPGLAQTMPASVPEYPAPARVERGPGLAAPTDEYGSPAVLTERGRLAGFLGWSFNTPMGSMKSFASGTSPLGFEFQLRWRVFSHLALGVSGEWASFVDERPRTTYTLGNVDLTATSYNQLDTGMARAGIYYYFLDSGPFLPYVGPHLGWGWATFEAQAADRVLGEDHGSLVWGADAGAEFPLGGSSPVLLANVRYSILPGAEFRDVVDDLRLLAVMVGVGF